MKHLINQQENGFYFVMYDQILLVIFFSYSACHKTANSFLYQNYYRVHKSLLLEFILK
jgi:hypothetical protein